jgi:hypothetical protein
MASKSSPKPEPAPTSSVEINATKLEKTIMEAVRTSKLGLPDWAAVAKNEHISLEYLQQRVDWARRAGLIK